MEYIIKKSFHQIHIKILNKTIMAQVPTLNLMKKND